MLLRLESIGKSFGARRLFESVSLDVRAGDRIALVGANGAGKTTLLRILAGEDPPDGGQVIRSRGVRVGMLGQEIDPGRRQTVREEAASALSRLDDLEGEMRALEGQIAALEGEVPPALAERYDHARTQFEVEDGFARGARVERVLAGLGFEAEDRERPLSSFSGGWLMRVELAKLLLAKPDVLLLDEPTNHLDLPSIQWFEGTLEEFPGAVVVISHDRTFLRRHARRIAELENGRFTLSEGSYDQYLEARAERRRQRLARKQSQDRQIAQTERFIERFRAKNTKARQVQSRIKALDRIERVEIEPEARRKMRLRIPAPRRAGEVVLKLENVHKSYGETRVYRGIDFSIRRAQRVALVGPNGAGKSTLLRIAAGVLPIDAGRHHFGHHVEVAFYAQHQLEVLDPTRTVLGELEAIAQLDDIPRLRGHLGAFLFSGDDVEKKVEVLSGGEKARLALAKLLLRPTNFLVLDEPTNHLDVDACEVLEEALASYTGTLLLISHDRSFLNAIADRVIEVRGGRLREFFGNYDDYLRKRDELDAVASAPGAVAGHGAPHSEPPTRHALRDRERAKERTRRRLLGALAKLEEQILEREQALETLAWKLGDPETARDGERTRALEAERSELQAAVDALYREWESRATELEDLDEADGEARDARLG